MKVRNGAVKLRLIAITVIALLGITTFLLLLLWWQQERIVFQPSGPPFPTLQAERVEYHTSDGQRLYAYIVGPPDSAVAGVLLVFHGNADLAVRMHPWAEEVARRTGWCVMLAEYRGYGGLSGTPSVAGARLDARAAARFALDTLRPADDRLALYGHSLGSAIAADLAAEVSVSRLILESPFTSARDMARMIIARPFGILWGVVSRVHYDTRARVAASSARVWVAHGDRDYIIPVRMGRDVFDAARNKGELLIVPGAGHNDVAELGGASYWSWLERALDTHTATSARS
jgi:fermentation-respiration switch protein FrsA (DUF1100 family)